MRTTRPRSELTGQCGKNLSGKEAAALQEAYDQVEDEEDEHLYHTKGWCRELWLKSLGLKAVLPPPEEKRGVKTAKEAAAAKEIPHGIASEVTLGLLSPSLSRDEVRSGR